MTNEAGEHVSHGTKQGTPAAVAVPERSELTMGRVLDISESSLEFLHTDEFTTEPNRAEILLLGHEQSVMLGFRIPAKFIHEHDSVDGCQSCVEFHN